MRRPSATSEAAESARFPARSTTPGRRHRGWPQWQGLPHWNGWPRRCGVAILLSLPLAACRPAPPQDAADANRPLVLASVPPVTLLARAVGDGCARVEPLLANARDSHTPSTTPSDLARLRRARVLVINGLGLEPYLPALLRAAENPDLRVIDSSVAVAPVLTQGRPDPHVWLDPQRALRQLQAIQAGLSAAEPGCAAELAARADSLRQSLLRLDRELATSLQPWRGALLVSSHPYVASFADRYGLRAEALVATPDTPPSPADLRRVLAQLRRGGPRALLQQPAESAGSIAALGRELGLSPVRFDSIEAEPAAPDAGRVAIDGADPLGTYLQVMRANGQRLVAALRASGGATAGSPPAGSDPQAAR